ncbi:MAG: ankyrin repeat domain-containing protein [Myxococcota bacterium]
MSKTKKATAVKKAPAKTLKTKAATAKTASAKTGGAKAKAVKKAPAKTLETKAATAKTASAKTGGAKAKAVKKTPPESPLHKAALDGDLKAVREILKKGVSPKEINQVREIGYRRGTPLTLASSEGHAPIVRLLLRNGADSTVRCGNFKWNALHLAADSCCVGVVKALVEVTKESVDVEDKVDSTALVLALESPYEKKKEVTEILLNAGADPVENARRFIGRTTGLKYAVEHLTEPVDVSLIESFHLMMEKGLKPNQELQPDYFKKFSKSGDRGISLKKWIAKLDYDDWSDSEAWDLAVRYKLLTERQREKLEWGR